MNVLFLGLFLGLTTGSLTGYLIWKKSQSQFIKKHQVNMEKSAKKIEQNFLLKLQAKDKEIAMLKEIIKQQKQEIQNLKLEHQNQINLAVYEGESLTKSKIQKAIESNIGDAEILSDSSQTLNLSFSPSDKLPNEYRGLQQYLINREWQNADQETSKILFELSSSIQGYLNIKDYQNLPLRELAIIDSLWAYYSNGLFGLSAQYQIYSDVCKGSDLNPKQWQKIGDLLGWRKNNQWVSGSQNLIISLDAPKGQFPFLSYWQGVWLGGFIDGQSDRFIALMSRFSDVF